MILVNIRFYYKELYDNIKNNPELEINTQKMNKNLGNSDYLVMQQNSSNFIAIVSILLSKNNNKKNPEFNSSYIYEFE